jgi:hypothetical protein
MYPSPHAQSAIAVELMFSFFAGGNATSTNFLTRKYNTQVEIDGVRYEREGGVWHVFPVAPGWHMVRVFFTGRPTFLSREWGEQRLQVLAYPNAMARLKYTGGAFWPMTEGSLVQVG